MKSKQHYSSLLSCLFLPGIVGLLHKFYRLKSKCKQLPYMNNTNKQSIQFSCSVMSNSLRPHGLQHAGLPCPSPTPWTCSNSWFIKSVMPSNHLILCCPLLLLPSIFPSIRVFSKESALRIRWPKYWSFSFSIHPSNEYSGLISFRMNCLYLLAVPRDSQESSPTPQFKSTPTVKRLPAMRETRVRFLGRESPLRKKWQSTPALLPGKSYGRRSLINYSPWGRKEPDTTEWLHFTSLNFTRLVMTFLPRSKGLLISWLQSPSAVILEPPKIKSDTVSKFPHLFPMEWWDQMPWSSFSECWVLSQFLHSHLLLSSRGFLGHLHFLP